MRTENFSLVGATGVFMRQGIIRVLRYDEGDAGGPTPLIRVTSMSGSDVDVEMRPGRLINIKEPINGMVIRNLSGATITGKFTWGDGNVEDNTFSGIFDLTTATINALIAGKYNTRPELQNGSWVDVSTLAANTPVTVFAPGVNTAGALLLSADISDYSSSTAFQEVLIAKGSAPASVTDGSVVLGSKHVAMPATGTAVGGTLPGVQLIAPGLGLYLISSAVTLAASGLRSCRYRLLP